MTTATSNAFHGAVEVLPAENTDDPITLIRQRQEFNMSYSIDELLDAAKLAVYMATAKNIRDQHSAEQNPHNATAHEFLTEAFEIDPRNPRAHELAAKLLLDMKEYGQSVDHAMRAIEAHGDITPGTAAALGKAYEAEAQLFGLYGITETGEKIGAERLKTIVTGYQELARGYYALAVEHADETSRDYHSGALRRFEFFSGQQASLTDIEMANTGIYFAILDIQAEYAEPSPSHKGTRPAASL